MREAAGAAPGPWWIIGSAAVALHGVSGVPPADIDLLMSRQDAADLLRRKGVEPGPGEPHGRFRSDVFGRWRAGAYLVETMGGFHLDGEEIVPVSRERKGGLFVPSVAELIALLERFGRTKDLERARLLRAL